MSIGVAFSGGGIKAAFHIGVLMALEEAGIDIEFLSGTSSGAIVASMYACGFSPYSILNIFNFYSRKVVEIDSKSVFKSLININKGSRCINKYDNLERILYSVFKSKKIFNINEVKKKLAICTVDINYGKVVYFVNSDKLCKEDSEIYINNGALHKIVRASSAYPVIFEPSYYMGRILVDGGVIKNIPISILKKMGASKLIGVDVSDNILPLKEISMINVGLRCIDIMGKCVNCEEISKADLLIRSTNVNTNNIGILDFRYINMLVEEGYKITKDIISKNSNVFY